MPQARQAVLGLFNNGNMTTEWNGPIATLDAGTPAQRCKTTTARRTSRACRDDDARRSSCSRATRTASSCRSRAPRSTSRTTPPTRAPRSARPSRSTTPSASRSTTSAAPRHADRRHRRPLAHEPDHGRGRERNGNPTGYSNNLITADGQTMRVPTAPPAACPPGGAAEPAAHRRRGPDLGQRPRRAPRPRHDRSHRPVRRADAVARRVAGSDQATGAPRLPLG